MEVGLYEQLVTKVIAAKLDDLTAEGFVVVREPMEQEEVSRYLAGHMIKVVKLALELHKGKDRLEHQIELVNKIVRLIAQEVDDAVLEGSLVDAGGKLLLAVYDRMATELPDMASVVREMMPYSRLSQSELFTGNKAGITLDSEMKKEISSSDEISILVSFIRFSGIRIFQKELQDFTARGGKLRVITTSYMGATDLKAIRFLAGLGNTEVKVSYNTTNERLHAKAYLFLRNTGFDTGYIGSSNISHSALTNGLEWNIKITTQEVSHLISKFKKTFEAYWSSTDFETFRLGIDDVRLAKALGAERSYGNVQAAAFFDIKPYTYQREILDKIHSERSVHGNFKNLIVAATGTGKTIISVFDYLQFSRNRQSAKLLFVAHRKEILVQAMNKFRGILKDNNFGDLWVDGVEPTQYDHIFASVQTLRSRKGDYHFEPDHFDYMVIDEVHHIAATSYRPLLQHFSPQVLLGLTATPDRMDGADILSDFNGKITAQIGLSEALNRKLLCPFQYFGITDDIDLTTVKWKNGRYAPGELTKIYTRNDQRVGSIIRHIDNYLTDVHKVKALCFCVTKEHAQYMAEKFVLAGFRADYLVSGEGRSVDRDLKRQRLISGSINYLFVVDMFNEGIDIPEIDTVLFLRPTESLTVFLQQLGRGLRLAEGKDCLTVLDFVGVARVEYDYTSKFRALVGKTNRSITKELENDFPRLPLGCAIVLERIAKQRILGNIKYATKFSSKRLLQLVQSYSSDTDRDLTIANFIDFYQVPLSALYKRGGWTKLLDNAGLRQGIDTALVKTIATCIYRKWLSCLSYSYFAFIIELIDHQLRIELDTCTANERLMATMLYYDLWQEAGVYTSIEESFSVIGGVPALLDEMRQIAMLRQLQISYSERPILLPYPCPLMVHSRYTRGQILAAFGQSTIVKKSSAREGTLSIVAKKTELLFVTLEKLEKHYSPSTLYDDYAITPDLFHWQSQNSTRADSDRGRSYMHHKRDGRSILLFVRERQKDENGNTFAYVYLGKVEYVDHYGSQPMSIRWRLDIPIPSFLYTESAKLALG